MDDDAHLLRLWSQEHRQSAFSALVARYAGVVFGTALRRLRGHRALAEEAAQNVFTLMAAKADSLARHPCLGAWLHRAAMWQAASMDRNEAVHTRKLHELAAAMHEGSNLQDSSSRTLPDLDAALERLPAPDRRVLIMRFFEECSFREIAKRIGLSEAAVQKRVSRALHRLSAQLKRRGITAGTAFMAAAFPPLFGQPVPAAVVERLTSTASSASVALSKSSTFIQTLSLMAYGKKTSLTIAALLAFLSVLTGSFMMGRQQALAGADPAFMADGAARAAGSAGSKFLPPQSSHDRSDRNQGRRRLSVREAIANVARGFGIWEATGLRHATADVPLRELLPEEFDEALRILPEFKSHPDAWESAAWFVFAPLAASDPARAAHLIDNEAFLREGRLPIVALRVIALHWAEKDGAATLKWMRSLDERGRGVGPKTWGDVMARQIKSDPAAALSDMASWPGREAGFEYALREPLKDAAVRDQLLGLLDSAGDEQCLSAAGWVPDDPSWLSERFLPWLFNREWSEPLQAGDLCRTLILRGYDRSLRLKAVCQALGAVSSPELAHAITDELRPLLRALPDDKRQPFLDCITDPALKFRIMNNP
jgi:RNA polymerase sigma factor (sigma-70 family)